MTNSEPDTFLTINRLTAAGAATLLAAARAHRVGHSRIQLGCHVDPANHDNALSQMCHLHDGYRPWNHRRQNAFRWTPWVKPCGGLGTIACCATVYAPPHRPQLTP